MSQPVILEDLLVVAYADVLLEAAVPRVTPPVFAFKDHPDQILSPPLTIEGHLVINGVTLSKEELADLAYEERVTLLPEPFEARYRHELWVDEDMIPYYEESTVVRQKLAEKAEQLRIKAVASLKAGDLKSAVLWAGRCLSAHPKHMDPWAIKAAVQTFRGAEGKVEIMREVALKYGSPLGFELLLDAYLNMIPKASHSALMSA